MATARNTTGAKKTTTRKKTTNTAPHTNQSKDVLSVNDSVVEETNTMTETPKLTQAKKGEFVETYKVPDGHNGIINPSANHLALGSAALTSGFTLQELHDLGADVNWLLETGQIVKDDIKIINQY